MSESALRIFARVVRRRLDNGETLDEILGSYPKLSNEEKTEIKAMMKINEEE